MYKPTVFVIVRQDQLQIFGINALSVLAKTTGHLSYELVSKLETTQTISIAHNTQKEP